MTTIDDPGMLNAFMEFGHVIRVVDGVASDTDIPSVIHTWAPSVYDGELDQLPGHRWSLLKGWSNQDRYSGPIMHDSEFIGGSLAQHILDTPGYWVALVSDYFCGEDCDQDDHEDCEMITEGWALAFHPLIEADGS